MSTRALLVVGGGGVGKTTLSAAFAVTAARRGLRTLVVTVDPARRLAAALGVDGLGSEPTPHLEEERLWAAMLDASASWQAIALRHAPPEVATRLVNNELFEAATQHFPASQSYAAAEEMANFIEAKVWDLVVVDTPPAAGGIEFFTAPASMRDLIGGRLLRWLTGSSLPGRRTMFNLTARPALRIADTVLGSHLLERVAEFLMDLRTTYDGLSRRAKEIERHFRRAAVVVVTTADPAPVREATRLFAELPDVARRPEVVVFNRSLPIEWTRAETALPVAGKHQTRLEGNLVRWASEAHRQVDVRTEFVAHYRTGLATIPWEPSSPTSRDALAALIEHAEGLDLARIGVG